MVAVGKEMLVENRHMYILLFWPGLKYMQSYSMLQEMGAGLYPEECSIRGIFINIF